MGKWRMVLGTYCLFLGHVPWILWTSTTLTDSRWNSQSALKIGFLVHSLYIAFSTCISHFQGTVHIIHSWFVFDISPFFFSVAISYPLAWWNTEIPIWKFFHGYTIFFSFSTCFASCITRPVYARCLELCGVLTVWFIWDQNIYPNLDFFYLRFCCVGLEMSGFQRFFTSILYHTGPTDFHQAS